MKTETETIPTYRTRPSVTGIGWVTVEKWDGDRYKPLTSFRSRDEAEDFMRGEYRQDEPWYCIDGFNLCTLPDREFEESSAHYIGRVYNTTKFEVAQAILSYAQDSEWEDWLERAIENIHDFDNEVEFHINRLIANPQAQDTTPEDWVREEEEPEHSEEEDWDDGPEY
jgi:hypothetical protein